MRAFAMRMWFWRLLRIPCFSSALGLLASGVVLAGEAVYKTDFEKSEIGSVPEEFLLLDGRFAVREDSGNKFLELPGTPLETYAVLFGPNEKEGMSVSARIFATNKGRRFPAFGVGLNGVAGYRLLVAPAKRRLELYRRDDVVAFVPYRWEPGQWLRFLLEVRPEGDASWNINGKVWRDGDATPEAWTIQFTDDTEPFSGNASVWGKPFSGTPIRYDDFQVNKL